MSRSPRKPAQTLLFVLTWAMIQPGFVAAQASPAEGPDANAAVLRPLRSAIVIEPGASCLDGDKLTEHVARWLGRQRVDERLRVEVRGSPRNKQVVSIKVRKANGDVAERRIADAPLDCDQLHQALGLSVALAIDATLLEDSAADSYRWSADASDEHDDDSLEQRANDILDPPEPAYFRLAAALQINLGSGVLTDVAPGLAVRVELGPLPWLDIRAGVYGTRITDQQMGTLPGSFDVELQAVRLDACASAVPEEGLRVALCGGFMLGSFRTVGKGYFPSRSDGQPWTSLVGGVDVQVRMAAWLSLGINVDLMVPFGTRKIEVQDGDGLRLETRALTNAGVVIGLGPVFQFF